MKLWRIAVCLIFPLTLCCSGAISEDLLFKKDGSEILGNKAKDDDKQFITCEGTKITIEKGDTVKPTDQKCKKEKRPRPPRPYPTPTPLGD